MDYSEKIKKIGEKTRNKYLYNIYNDVDYVEFFQSKYNENKKIRKKIKHLIDAVY